MTLPALIENSRELRSSRNRVRLIKIKGSAKLYNLPLDEIIANK